jgi:hypothetical protein
MKTRSVGSADSRVGSSTVGGRLRSAAGSGAVTEPCASWAGRSTGSTGSTGAATAASERAVDRVGTAARRTELRTGDAAAPARSAAERGKPLGPAGVRGPAERAWRAAAAQPSSTMTAASGALGGSGTTSCEIAPTRTVSASAADSDACAEEVDRGAAGAGARAGLGADTTRSGGRSVSEGGLNRARAAVGAERGAATGTEPVEPIDDKGFEAALDDVRFEADGAGLATADRVEPSAIGRPKS